MCGYTTLGRRTVAGFKLYANGQYPPNVRVLHVQGSLWGRGRLLHGPRVQPVVWRGTPPPCGDTTKTGDQIIGISLIHQLGLHHVGSQSQRPISIIELGPGNGTLLCDVLRVCGAIQVVSGHNSLCRRSPLVDPSSADSKCATCWSAARDSGPYRRGGCASCSLD